MTKIDIISGFLGAGKTTLIKKLLKECFGNEQVVLIENEFGEISIDSGFLKESGIEIREMASGCICCSLVGDFRTSLQEVISLYDPDRILIEPSGVGKLSDVISAVSQVTSDEIKLNSYCTVTDVTKCSLYLKNFGEFYKNQLEHAGSIILSRTDRVSAKETEDCLAHIREVNPSAPVVTTPIDLLSGAQILEVMESVPSLEDSLLEKESCPLCGHDHHHHEDCHDHHHHHHADEVFQSVGKETARLFSKEEIRAIIEKLNNEELYGTVLRAKGIVASADSNEFIHFDMVPGESDLRLGSAQYSGMYCVIGSDLKEDAIHQLFLSGDLSQKQ